MSYVKLKQNLVEVGFDWMKTFDETIDDFIYQTVKPLESKQPPYNPYLVEKNLTALAASIDRALALRSAANDLEEKAFRQAQDYLLFQENASKIKELETAVWVKAQLEEESKHQLIAQNKFSESGSELGPGFSAASFAVHSSNLKAIDGEKTKSEIIKDKWYNIENHQKSLQSRHKQPGHALNYEQRADRIKAFLAEELETLYFRAKAVSAGVDQLFTSIEFSQSKLPKLTKPKKSYSGDVEKNSYLDSLGLWARRIARQLTIIKQAESTFEITISASQPMAEQKSLIEDTAFKNSMDDDGKVELNLKDYFPDELGNLRILGVAVSIGHHEAHITTDYEKSSKNTRALIFPPSQTNLYVKDSDRKISPLILDRVKKFDPNSRPSYLRDPKIENGDPKGIWKIQIADYFLKVRDKSEVRTGINLTDIKLHFLLATELNTDEADWDDPFWGKKPTD